MKNMGIGSSTQFVSTSSADMFSFSDTKSVRADEEI